MKACNVLTCYIVLYKNKTLDYASFVTQYLPQKHTIYIFIYTDVIEREVPTKIIKSRNEKDKRRDKKWKKYS